MTSAYTSSDRSINTIFVPCSWKHFVKLLKIKSAWLRSTHQFANSPLCPDSIASLTTTLLVTPEERQTAMSTCIHMRYWGVRTHNLNMKYSNISCSTLWIRHQSHQLLYPRWKGPDYVNRCLKMLSKKYVTKFKVNMASEMPFASTFEFWS